MVENDRMTAWACVNAILAFLGEPEVLFGEWRDATDGQSEIEVIEIAHKIRRSRGMSDVLVPGRTILT